MFCAGNRFLDIPISWHDHMFIKGYTNNFTGKVMEVLTHVRAIGTRLLSPLLICRLGMSIGAKFMRKGSRVVVHNTCAACVKFLDHAPFGVARPTF